MRIALLSLLVIMLVSISIQAEKHTIKKIIDTNLFELENEQRVKLYGLEVPTLKDSNQVMKKIAMEIIEWNNNNLLGNMLSFDFIIRNKDGVYEVVIYTLRSFARDNINEIFLLNGFAALQLDENDFYYPDLREAELTAQNNKRGIWAKQNAGTDFAQITNFPQFAVRYERPYLPLLGLSLVSFALAWDNFASADDIQKSIDALSENADKSTLESAKNRKTIIGVTCILAGIVTTVFSFKEVEVKADLQSLSLSYRF